MSKLLWRALEACPIALGASLILTSGSWATTTQPTLPTRANEKTLAIANSIVADKAEPSLLAQTAPSDPAPTTAPVETTPAPAAPANTEN